MGRFAQYFDRGSQLGQRLILGWLCCLGLIAAVEGRAKEFAGSAVGVEAYRPEKVHYNTIPATTRRSFEQESVAPYFRLLVPVAARLLQGILVPEVFGRSLQRQFDGDDRPGDFWHERLGESRLGVKYIPHASEGAPRYFVAAYRQGALFPQVTTPPMSEYWVGCDLDEYPYIFKFFSSDYTESQVALRVRSFPHGMRYLPFFRHTIQTIGGFRLRAAFPEGLRLQYGPSRTYAVHLAWHWESWQFPLAHDEVTQTPAGWWEGYRESWQLGGRIRFWRPFYVAAVVGMARQVWDEFSLSGRKQVSLSTSYTPYASLAVEAWTITP